MKRDKSYYKATAQTAAAIQFAQFNAKAFADEVLEWAQQSIATGTPHAITDWGRCGGEWAQYMRAQIDGTQIASADWVRAILDDAARELHKAFKAGVEGAFDEMQRVMDYSLSIAPKDADED